MQNSNSVFFWRDWDRFLVAFWRYNPRQRALCWFYPVCVPCANSGHRNPWQVMELTGCRSRWVYSRALPFRIWFKGIIARWFDLLPGRHHGTKRTFSVCGVRSCNKSLGTLSSSNSRWKLFAGQGRGCWDFWTCSSFSSCINRCSNWLLVKSARRCFDFLSQSDWKMIGLLGSHNFE